MMLPSDPARTHVRQTSCLRPLSSRALRRAPVLGPVLGRCASIALGGELIAVFSSMEGLLKTRMLRLRQSGRDWGDA